MLKTKLTEAEWGALSETEKQHYTKDAAGAYLLQHDEAVTMKRALEGERRRAETAEKLLKRAVPDLPEDKTEWEHVVGEFAETAKERAAVDLDEWKAFKADSADPSKKKDKDALDAERLDLQRQVRELTRERDTWNREKTKLEKKTGDLATENLTLARTAALNEALDAVKITDPADREIVTALFTMRGLEPQEVTGKGRVFFVKTTEGAEVPLSEYAKDFVGTEQGKRYVKAPDSAGAGDGTPAPVVPVAAKTFEGLSPSQQLTAALSPGGVAGLPAAK